MLCLKTNYSMLRFIFFLLLLVDNNFDHSGISLSSSSPQIYTYTGISPLTQRLDRRYAKNYNEKRGYGYQGNKYDDQIDNGKYKSIDDNQLLRQYNFGQRGSQYELNEGDRGIKNIPFSGYTISDESTGLRQFDSKGYLRGSESSGAKQFGSSGYLSGSGNSDMKKYDSSGYIHGIGSTGGRYFDSSGYMTGIGGKQRRHFNSERYITSIDGTGTRNIDSTGYITTGNYGSAGARNTDSLGYLTSNLYNQHNSALSSSNFDTSSKNIGGGLPRNLIRKCIITNNLNDCNYFIDIGSSFTFSGGNDGKYNSQKNPSTGSNQQQIRKCAITGKLEDCNEFILVTFTTKQDQNILSTTTNNYNGIIDGNRIRKCIITGNLQDCGTFVTILNYSERGSVSGTGGDIVTQSNFNLFNTLLSSSGGGGEEGGGGAIIERANLIRKCLITNKHEDCDEFIEIPKNQNKSVTEIEDTTSNRQRFQTIRKCAITEKLDDCNKFVAITYNSLLGETEKEKSKEQAGHQYVKKCVITNKLNDCDKFIEINYNLAEENGNQNGLIVMQPPIKHQIQKCIITNKIDDCGKFIEITLNDQGVLNSYDINSLASFNTANVKETKVRKCLLTNQIDDCNEFISYPYQQQNDQSNFHVISTSGNYHQEGIRGDTHKIRLCAITNNVEDCNRFVTIEYNPLKDRQYIDKNHLFNQMEPLPNVVDSGGFLNHNKEKLEQSLPGNYKDQLFPIDNNDILSSYPKDVSPSPPSPLESKQTSNEYRSSYEQFPNRGEEINEERRNYGQENDFYLPHPHHYQDGKYHYNHHQDYRHDHRRDHHYHNQPEYQHEGVIPDDNSKRYHTQYGTSYHNEKFVDRRDFRKYPNRYYRDESIENIPREMGNPSKSVLQNKEVQKWSSSIGIPSHQNHRQYYNEEHHRHYHKQNQGDTTGREDIYSASNFEQRPNNEPNRFVSSEQKTDYLQQLQYGEIPHRQKEIHIYRDQQQPPPPTYSSENPPDYNQQFENLNKLNLNEISVKNQPFRGQFKETIRNPTHQQNTENNKPEYYHNNKYITGNEGKNYKYYTNYYGHEKNLPVGVGRSKEELQVSGEKEGRYEQRYGEAKLPQSNNNVHNRVIEKERSPENFRKENNYKKYEYRYGDHSGQQGGLPVGSGKLPEDTIYTVQKEKIYEQRYGKEKLPQNNNYVQSPITEAQRQPENFRQENNYKQYEHRYGDNTGQGGGLPVGSGKLPEGTVVAKHKERRYEQRYGETELPQNNNNVQSQITETQRQPENFRQENNYKQYEYRYGDNTGQGRGLPVESGKLPEGTVVAKHKERRYEQRYGETELPQNNNNVQSQITETQRQPENFRQENNYKQYEHRYGDNTGQGGGLSVGSEKLPEGAVVAKHKERRYEQRYGETELPQNNNNVQSEITETQRQPENSRQENNYKQYEYRYGDNTGQGGGLPVGSEKLPEGTVVAKYKERRYEQRYGETELPENNNNVQSQITETQRQPENSRQENNYKQYEHRYGDNTGQGGGLPVGSEKLPEGAVVAKHKERRYEQRYGETELPENNNNVQSQITETQRQPENSRQENNYKQYEHRYGDNTGQGGGLPVGSEKLPEGTVVAKYKERRYEQRYGETELPENNNNVQSQITETQRQPENSRQKNNYKQYEHRYGDNTGQGGGLPVGSGKLPKDTDAAKDKEKRYEPRYGETKLLQNYNNVQNQTNIDQVPENTIELPFKREDAYILGNDKKAIASGKRIFPPGISDYYSEMRYNSLDEPEIYMCRNRNGVKECHKFVSSVKFQEQNRSKLTCNCKDGMKCKCDDNMNAKAGKDGSFSCRCNDFTKTFQSYDGFQCQCVRDLNSDNALTCQCNTGTGNNDKRMRSLTCQNSSNTKPEQSVTNKHIDTSYLGIAVTSNPIVNLETERTITISKLYTSSFGLGVTSNPISSSRIGQAVENDQHFTSQLGLAATSNPIDSSEVGRTERNVQQFYTSSLGLAVTSKTFVRSEAERKETNSSFYTSSLGIAVTSNPIGNSETGRTVTNNQPNTSHLVLAVMRKPNHSSKGGRNVTIYENHTPNLRLTETANNKISSGVGPTVPNNRSDAINFESVVTSNPVSSSEAGRNVRINHTHTSHQGRGRNVTINQIHTSNAGLTGTDNHISSSGAGQTVTTNHLYTSSSEMMVTSNPLHNSRGGRKVSINQSHTSHSGLTGTGNKISSRAGRTNTITNNQTDVSNFGLTVASKPIGNSESERIVTNKQIYTSHLNGSIKNNPFASSAGIGNKVSSSKGGQTVKNNHLYTSYYNPTGGSEAGQTVTNRHIYTTNLGLTGTGNSESERTVYGNRNGSSKFGVNVSAYQTGASNYDQYGMGQKSFERDNYQIVNQTYTTYGTNKLIKYRFSCNCYITTIGLHCNCHPTGMKYLANNTATCWCSKLAANDRSSKCDCANDVTELGFVAKLPQKGTWCQCNKVFDINATESLICPCPFNPKYNATFALNSFLTDTKSNLIASNVINSWNSSNYGRNYGNFTRTYNTTHIYKPYKVITYNNTTVLPPKVITIKKPSKIVTTVKRTETHYQTNNKMANFSKDSKGLT